MMPPDGNFYLWAEIEPIRVIFCVTRQFLLMYTPRHSVIQHAVSIINRVHGRSAYYTFDNIIARFTRLIKKPYLALQ